MSELTTPTEIGVAFGTAFLTEALTPGKLSTVSSLLGVKDLTPDEFIHAAPLITHELIKAAERGFKGKRLFLGRTVREITFKTLRNKWVGTNVSLGYAILSTGLTYMLGKALRQGITLVNTPDIVDSLMKDLLNELMLEDACCFYEAVSHSESHLGTYFGPIPDVKDMSECRNVSLYQVLTESSLDDEVSDEVVNGYPRTLLAYWLLKRLRLNTPILKSIVETHTHLLKLNPDTLILKSKGLPTAFAVMKMANEGRKRLRALDRFLRSQGINPGSTSDLISCSIGLILVERIEDIYSS